MTVYLAEAIGTMILVILGNGVVANVVLNRTKGQNSGWMVITTGWGLAVTVAVYSVGRISGAHINPAVTFGLASIGAFSWSQVPGYLLAQMLGAVLGAVIVYLVYRALSGRTDGLCHQPRPRPGTAYCLRSPSHSREGKSGLGLQLDSRVRPDSGGCFGGLALCDRWFLIPERK